jgi:hypothetical protein
MYIILKNIKTTDKNFDGLLTEIGLLAIKYCYEFECEHNKKEDFKQATSDRTAVDKLIEKYEKRLKLIRTQHDIWLEQKKNKTKEDYRRPPIYYDIMEFVGDLKDLSRADL